MFSTVLVSLTICFGFAFFVFILDIYFSRKKLVLINLNAVIKIYSKMWESCMHPDYDHFVYSINFQKNANSSHKPIFLLEITTLFLLSLLLCGSRFLKKKNFSRYNRLANREKLILSLEKYFRTLKDMIIGTESFTIFKKGETMVSNNGHLMSIQRHFQIKLPLILILQMK